MGEVIVITSGKGGVGEEGRSPGGPAHFKKKKKKHPPPPGELVDG